MSWDATLYDDRGHCEGDWNYTHNCNGMANAVIHQDYDESITVAGEILFRHGQDRWPSWWKLLDGMKGHEGAEFLTRIIKGLEAEPARFRAMNPDNGWGDYDSFLKTLIDMRDAVPENWPTIFSASG